VIRVERAGPPSVHALGFAVAGAVLLAIAAVFPLDAPPLSLLSCPFRAATGWPCLTCGCTHAFAAVVRLDLAAALRANPLGAVLAIACSAHGLWTALRCAGLRWAPALERVGAASAARLRVAVVALLAANWIYVAAHGAP
jgi:hypothetical protein